MMSRAPYVISHARFDVCGPKSFGGDKTDANEIALYVIKYLCNEVIVHFCVQRTSQL